MDGRKASIAFRKSSGDFGPRKFLEPNKLFVIGTEIGNDIRLTNRNNLVRYVFELDEDGMVTLTDDALPNDDTSRKRVFTSLRETFVIEGRTFEVAYLHPDEVEESAPATSVMQRKSRMSCIPTFDARNMQDSEDMPFVTKQKRQAENLDVSRSILRTPRRPSTNSEVIVTPPPRTPIPARTTPSARRSIVRRQSMATLAEEDESNSNDSKYKTPENNTSVPKIVMRSHKSSIKCKLDGEGTPKCISPFSGNKSRRSLLVYDDFNNFDNNSPNSSDDESNDKCNITITTTSTSSGTDMSTFDLSIEEEHDIPAVENEEIVAYTDVDVYKRQSVKLGKKIAKRFRESDDEAEGEIQQPKKRMRRESTYSFRDESIADSSKINTSIDYTAKKRMTHSSSANTSASDKEYKNILRIAPNTIPRAKKRSKSFLHNMSAVETQTKLTPTTKQSAEEENDCNSTDSSSFTYIPGEYVDSNNLGLSVFTTEPNDTVHMFGGDLMRFSDIKNTPPKPISVVDDSTPDKQLIDGNLSTGRKSSRVIKPKVVFTPDQTAMLARTPKRTPARRDIASVMDLPGAKMSIGTPGKSTINNLNDKSGLLGESPQRSGKKAMIKKSFGIDDEDCDGSLTGVQKTVQNQRLMLLRTPVNSVIKERNKSSTKKSSLIDDSFTELPGRIPLSPRNVQKNNSYNSNKSLIISTKSPKASLLYDDLIQENANLIPDAHVESPVNRKSRTPGKTPKNIDPIIDSDDSLIENNSTPFPNRHVNKSLAKFIDTPVPEASPIVMITKSEKTIVNTSSFNTKSVNFTLGVRRSGRTPKSVFRRNSILDESIFDTSTTSTKQSHSNKSISDLTGQSMSRSLSVGDSISRNVLKNSDDSLGKVSVSLRKRSLSVGGLKPPLDPTAKRSRGSKGLNRTPKLQKGPKNDLGDLRGVRKLMATPKPVKQPSNDLSDVKGVRIMFQTPRVHLGPKNDLTNVQGVKQLLRTPKFQAGPQNDLSDLRGVKKLLGTPKRYKEPLNDLSDIRGVRDLLKTPREPKGPRNDLSDFTGVKQLMTLPKATRAPKNDLTNVAGVKRLMTTPKAQKEPRNDLTDVFGVKKLLQTPKIRSNYIPDYTDISGVEKLFDLNDDCSDDASVTSTTSLLVAVDLPAAKAVKQRTRLRAQIVEEPVVVRRQTRARKAVVLKEIVAPQTKARAAKKKAVKEVEEDSTSGKTRKRIVKRILEPTSTEVEEEIIEEVPVQPKGKNTRKRVATAKITEANEQQVEEVSSTIFVKPKTTTRKRGIAKPSQAAPEIVEEFEQVVKKTRTKSTKIKQVEDVDEEQPIVKKTRARKTKNTPVLEFIPEVVSGAKRTRGRSVKSAPVQEDDEDDIIFTHVEQIVDKAPKKAVRVTRTRRNQSKQAVDSYDIESADNLTTVEVKKVRGTKVNVTKHVQFDVESIDSPVAVRPRPKSRRLLSADDIDSITDEVQVVSRARKSARARK